MCSLKLKSQQNSSEVFNYENKVIVQNIPYLPVLKKLSTTNQKQYSCKITNT